MSPIQIVVLALVQAVTEFLPISSSGHLILIPRLLGWGDQGLSFDIATNTGTLLAVILYFRRDLAGVAREALAAPAVWRPDAPAGARLAWLLLLGTLPAAVVGLLAHRWISTAGRNPVLIACDLIVWGLLLGVADRFARERRDEGSLSPRDALLVGCAQALALVPGTSRSGITITALLLLGLSRPAAARFSFLLAVPVGLLAEAKDLLDHLLGDGIEAGALTAMLLGVVVSAVAGYAVIAWLLAWLRRRSLMVFVVYRVAFGLALLTWALS
jgi:undecaprenyl-diphosphatase